MKEFTVYSPTKVALSQYKKSKPNIALNRVGKYNFFSLNLNQYRNAHFSKLDKSKKVYFDVMYQILVKEEAHYCKFEQVSIEYQIIACNKRKFDTMNIVSIVDKYFQDVLVRTGIIPDDSYKVVREIKIAPVIISNEFTENVCRATVRGA